MVVFRMEGLNRDVLRMGMEGIDTHFSIHEEVTLLDPLLFINGSHCVLLVDAVLQNGHGWVVPVGHVVKVTT